MRTTRAQIAGIIELDAEIVPDDNAMEAFISIASEFVTECCTGTSGPTSSYSEARLELIERWLSAHFYTNRDPRLTNEKAGPVGGTFQSKVDLGFDTSHYGQTAMRLDTNGGLAEVNIGTKNGTNTNTIGVAWGGSTTNYDLETEGY